MKGHMNLAAEIIEKFEGVSYSSYRCPAGVWTIGWGHTKGVQEGLVIDHEKAVAYLMEDMREADDCITKNVKVGLNDNQRAALVSFIFNVGCGAFRSSTMLRLLNASDFARTAEQFERWNKSKGKVLAGLTRRRLAERDLFNA